METGAHAAGGRTALLATHGTTKSYGANVALEPTDFTLSAGERVAIIGENGAGKSTFAKSWWAR